MLTLGILAGALPSFAHAAPEGSQGRQYDLFWRNFDSLLDAINGALGGTGLLEVLAFAESEQDALQNAMATTRRFQASGVNPELSPDEIKAALDSVGEARKHILDNPGVFTDPYWSSFLGTLDEIQFALANH